MAAIIFFFEGSDEDEDEDDDGVHLFSVTDAGMFRWPLAQLERETAARRRPFDR